MSNTVTIDGDRFKSMREAKHFTQKKLAEAIGMTESTIYKNERPGHHEIYRNTLIAIITTLAIEASDICVVSEVVHGSADEFVEELPILESDDENESGDSSVQQEHPTITLSPYADEPLKMATAGLLKQEGSEDRVSVAIACVAGYLRSIVWRAPDLKCHTQGLIASITPALGSSLLDTHPVVMGELWSGIKNNLASLAELESLPAYAQNENRMVIDLLMQSRLNNDNSEKLRAVRAALYWLRDYWQYICQEMTAYYAWNDICCVLTGAPTDYTTRSYIISQINEFALYVSIHDPIYKMVHKGGRNV